MVDAGPIVRHRSSVAQSVAETESLRPWTRNTSTASVQPRLGKYVIISLLVHVMGMATALSARKPAPANRSTQTVAVTLVQAPAPPLPQPEPEHPPTPPPPPPPIARAPRFDQPTVLPKPAEVPQPVALPVMAAKDESQVEATNQAVVNEAPSAPPPSGVEGGVPGGIPGGVVGGTGRTILPPLPPPKPMRIDVEYARKRRIAGGDPPYPRRAEADGIEGLVEVKIFIDPSGKVSQVVFLRGHPAFDDTVRKAIGGWRFSPHVVSGVAVPVYTVFRFTFQLA